MSAFGIVAIVAAGLWLAAATIALLALVRQVALLTLRLDRMEEGPTLDGISVGSAAPPAVKAAVPEATEGRAHVLVLSATCAPCRELADELESVPVDDPVVALIGGETPSAAAIGERLPPPIRVVLDPEASQAVDRLDLRTSPFLFTFDDGTVADKASVRNAAHLSALLEASRRRQAEIQHPMEVTHVR
ncbi:MAG TPA: hypothetical protein VGW75_09365 [Solirubrobacteraceae bacterium]|jgi:hypothetical protein|nr:hypothetical protein [Solirubrobacteraceae bacterium]